MFTKNLLSLMQPVQIALFACVGLLLCIVGQNRISQEDPSDFLAGVYLEEEVFEPLVINSDIGIDPELDTDLIDSFANRFPKFLEEPVGMPDDVENICGPIMPVPNDPTVNIARLGGADSLIGSGEMTIGILRTGPRRNAEESAALFRGVMWLAKQQIPLGENMGYWEFDGGTRKDWRIGATGLALLTFVAGGQKPIAPPKRPRPPELADVPEWPTFHVEVSRGLNYLYSRQRVHGGFVGLGGKVHMTEQALATRALCEYSALLQHQDPKLMDAATRAAEFIVQSQAENGSWGERPNEKGDTLTVASQLLALRSAELGGLKVAGLKRAMKHADTFLESVMIDTNEGFSFGFDKKGNGTHACTAAGIVGRICTGWVAKNPSLERGLVHLKKNPPAEPVVDVLTHFYATQAIYLFTDKKAWFYEWYMPMLRAYIRNQHLDTGDNRGSWSPKFDGLGGENGVSKQFGRVGTTCFSLLTVSITIQQRRLEIIQRASKEPTLFDRFAWE